jgi:hypothetical protein
MQPLWAERQIFRKEWNRKDLNMWGQKAKEKFTIDWKEYQNPEASKKEQAH